LIGIGTDQEGGLRIPASNAGVYTLKSTSSRISSGTIFGCRDSIASTPGPICNSFENLEYVIQIIISATLQSKDYKSIPLPFERPLYNNIVSEKRLTIGFYIDDGLIRASPATKRAVYLAASAMQERGHLIVRFIPPSIDKAFITWAKLQAINKTNLKCLKASIEDQITKLAPIFAWYHLLKVPQFIKKTLVYWFGYGMNDPILMEYASKVGGGSGKTSRHLSELDEINEERDEYCRMFHTAWSQPALDVIICPPHACPPMKNKSNAFAWVGEFYSSLYNFLDYPVGIVPGITSVQTGDVIQNTVQYAHQDRYIAQSARKFNLLATMALEEVNCCVRNGSIVGEPIGVQVVGKPFEEEKVLGVINILNAHFHN
jgi:amidase